MRHYRALFDDLVEPAADQPTRRDQLDQLDQQEDIPHQPSERTVR
jgi:hypothetical protein